MVTEANSPNSLYVISNCETFCHRISQSVYMKKHGKLAIPSYILIYNNDICTEIDVIWKSFFSWKVAVLSMCDVQRWRWFNIDRISSNHISLYIVHEVGEFYTWAI